MHHNVNRIRIGPDTFPREERTSLRNTAPEKANEYVPTGAITEKHQLGHGQRWTPAERRVNKVTEIYQAKTRIVAKYTHMKFPG